MNHFKRTRVNTTVGDLITVLSEETACFSKNPRENSIVVGYIFNDLVKVLNSRVGATGHTVPEKMVNPS